MTEELKETYKKNIYEMISGFTQVSDHYWDELKNRLEFVTYKRNEIITKAGELENHLYILVEGSVRTYYSNSKKEYTISFSFAGSAFSSYASLVTRNPSRLEIQALSEVKAFRLTYEDIAHLNENTEDSNIVGRKMLEYYYLSRENKEIDLLSKTAEENYFDLFKKQPEIISSISQKHIASYLGITPESLSRIRRKVANY